MISVLGCLAIILLVFILKKYKDPAQRLVLYLTIAVVMNSINSIVRGIGAGLDQIGKTSFCEAVGFISGYTSGCILLAICCIITELFIKTILNKSTGNLINIVYCAIIYIPSAFIFAIPFIHGNYGQEGPTCWITTARSNANCSGVDWGLIEQITLWYVPVFIIVLAGGVLYIMSLLVLNRKLNNHRQVYTNELKRLERRKFLEDIKQFRWYPPIFFVINVVPLLTRILDKYIHIPHEFSLTLWIITAIIDGLQGLFISLAFTLDSQTRRSLSCKNIKQVCLTCGEQDEYLKLTGGKADTSSMKYSTLSAEER